jgi:hypothetical protein
MSDLEAAVFDLERRVVSILESASASLRAPAAVLRSLESLLAALSDAALSEAAWPEAAALSRDRLSGAACESSARRGAGVGEADVSSERLSALPAAALLPTRAAKLSFPDAWSESDRADLGGAP